MMLPPGSITLHASRGRIGVQVPHIDIDPSPSSVEHPDEWFCWLRDLTPCVGRQKGFLYLTEAGWNANREAIRDAFEQAIRGEYNRGKSWSDFEDHVAEHFATVRARKAAAIAKRMAELSELRSFTP